MSSTRRSPADFLKQTLGRQVTVKLVDEVYFSGTLVCLDGTLNLVLEKAEEIRDGKVVGKYNKIFLRGNNVFYITPGSTRKQPQAAAATPTPKP